MKYLTLALASMVSMFYLVITNTLAAVNFIYYDTGLDASGMMYTGLRIHHSVVSIIIIVLFSAFTIYCLYMHLKEKKS